MIFSTFKPLNYQFLILILVAATAVTAAVSKPEDCDQPEYLKYVNGGIVPKMGLKPDIIKEVIAYRTECMKEGILNGLDPRELSYYESDGNRTVSENLLKHMACFNRKAHIYGDFDKMDVSSFDRYVNKDINAEVKQCMAKHERTCYGRIYEAFECYVNTVMKPTKDKKDC